jgi:hypothetical protein
LDGANYPFSAHLNRAQCASEVAQMTNIPNDPDALLTRDRIAAALTDAGFPVTAATLATMATRGGGPIFRKFSNRPLYRWGDGLEWAQSRLSKPIRTTSELGVT